MKLTWLQDLDFMSWQGGAEFTDRSHFIAGLRRGHDITLITPSTPLPEMAFAPADAVIISNAVSFNMQVFQRFQEMGRPLIWFFHDYFPICKYRLFYPMAEKCRACYLRERWLPLLLSARLLIWLSPLHRSSWLSLVPELEKVPFALIPSPVDGREFYDLRLPRQGVITVNSLAPFKGRDNVLKWISEHPDEPVTVVGAEGGPLPPNCTYVGLVPYHQLNELYNRHQSLLHLPSSPMPFDRTVAEAYLAGCHIISNELVGALSWPFFRDEPWAGPRRSLVAMKLSEAPNRFWEAVENALRSQLRPPDLPVMAQ